MKYKTILVAAILIIIGGGIYTFVRVPKAEAPGAPNNASESPVRLMSIEDYIKQNISALSPEKEVLGGKFYVTNVEAKDGRGTVSYEDGHIAFTADFSYTQSDRGYTITDFKIRK